MEVVVVLGQMMVVTVVTLVVAVVGAVVITITAWPAFWILTQLHSQCSCSRRFRCRNVQ